MIKLATLFYLLGAVITFDFAAPIDCHAVTTKAELRGCVRNNIHESAIAGATWPVFWARQVVTK